MQIKRKNYRSIYGRDEIPESWEIHHIDFDKHNNDKDNLIAIPKEVHVVVHQCGYCDREEINSLISIYKNKKKKMIRIEAPKGDIKRESKKVTKDISATIYVSETGLLIDIDDSKIKKYKTFIKIETNFDGVTKNEILEMIGYEEALTSEQVTEQFEILKKNASEIKKTNTLHS